MICDFNSSRNHANALDCRQSLPKKQKTAAEATVPLRSPARSVKAISPSTGGCTVVALAKAGILMACPHNAHNVTDTTEWQEPMTLWNTRIKQLARNRLRGSHRGHFSAFCQTIGTACRPDFAPDPPPRYIWVTRTHESTQQQRNPAGYCP